MGAAREKDQADFDLERFVDIFDEALTSQDPRVMNALRSLMMMVTLTRPETSTPQDGRHGALRRLIEDVNHLNNRLHRMEHELDKLKRSIPTQPEYPYEKYSLQQEMSSAKIDQDILNRPKSAAITKGLK